MRDVDRAAEIRNVATNVFHRALRKLQTVDANTLVRRVDKKNTRLAAPVER